MAEEQKPQEQKPKEQKPQEQKPKEAAKVPAPALNPNAVSGSGPAQAPDASKKKNKKISQMNLKEVEEKLNTVREKMGRLDSRYAKELLKRKDTLKQ